MKKLFTNDKFFGAVVVLAIICTVLYSAYLLAKLPGMFLCVVSDFVKGVCIAVLFISYQNHSKNVMKGMMGALLMQMFTTFLLGIGVYDSTFLNVLTIIHVVVIALLLINHFVINSSRNASPAAILLNQLFCILYAVIITCIMVYFFIIDESVLDKLSDVLNAVAAICTAAAIVCVESRLDAYRIDREAAGWTEEKGYPEGYVHEYEKKENR